jgi:hypothetical protein
MGTVVLNGATSGSTTLQPTDAVTATLTLPSVTSTLAIQGPAFSAYSPSGAFQSVSSVTNTNTVLANKNFDTATCFNNTGSTVTLNGISTPAYAFAPNVAGYYQISAYVNNTNNTNATYTNMILFKNGSAYPPYGQMGYGLASTNSYAGASGAILVYMNGTSDYLQLYTYSNSNTSLYECYFNGFLARAA